MGNLGIDRFKYFTPEEREMIHFSLGLRKNKIETGDFGMALEDASKQGIKVRPMSEGQMELSLKHRKLMREALRCK